MEINWIAVIVGAISSMVIGFVWYNPKVFGTVWMKALGKTEEELKQGNMAMIMIVSLLMAVVIAYGFGRYAAHTEEGMSQFLHGMYHGFMPAILYVIPVLVTNSLYEQTGWGGIIVSALYWLVTLCVMGGVIYTITSALAEPEVIEEGSGMISNVIRNFLT